MNNLTNILYLVLNFVQKAGLITIMIIGMGVLVVEAARSRLSVAKILGVTGAAVLAATLFWILPALINYARSDSNSIVPNFPVGGYY
ncbi:hypothetical protein NN3_18190 [Nocardia neocaledoniensis NBRC 108232]|uniref:Uncharacterized protein n=1 Tax=Nocardia neocaledoniensis TaxID=236511 RepID=A0A317NA20_9NOCA|nr:hypothetical protein [Nocardia neocaledoniensis]PWV70458.1 hypothetical protein DFR69_113172 [Nocardia neocaledoniensis]GEM30812.1 hypothetical protein NN3_18190 [Nocardia neocaledoniensis NBRC 108232]